MPILSRDTAWTLLGTGSTILAGVTLRNALKKSWQHATEKELPLHPEQEETAWQDALAWAMATGLIVGVGRLLARRLASGGWEKATGSKPPAF